VGAISVPLVKMVFMRKANFTLIANCSRDVKLVAETALSVAVLMFAQNAIQVYHTWILTKNASAWLGSNLTLLQIFVSRVVIFTMLLQQLYNTKCLACNSGYYL
jgi:hypothetical protein